MSQPIAEQNWALDREVVIMRVYDAPRELVFDAFTPEQLEQLHAMLETLNERVDPGGSGWPRPPAI